MMTEQGKPLPKDILKKCTPMIKNKLSQFMDLQNVKIIKVKGHKDPKCKTAYMKIYVMTDEYTKTQRDDDYAVKFALINHWTKKPTWDYYNPGIDRFEKVNPPLAKDVAEYYVLLQSDRADNDNAYFKMQNLKHARKDAKTILDPHNAQRWDYEGMDGQIINQKLYVSAMVGAKIREFKIRLIKNELDKIAEKFKFKDDENKGYHISPDMNNKNIGLYTYSNEEGRLDVHVYVANANNITVFTDLHDFMVEQSHNRCHDAKKIGNNLRHMADICDNVTKFKRALRRNKKLKTLLTQIA